MRYTEARLTAAAMAMVAVHRRGHRRLHARTTTAARQSPTCCPPAFPNLLVNGTAGIAVGMATNMAPHNLGEVVAAARYLIKHPDAALDDLMRFVPGPDLPTGGRIVGLDGIREAYETGRGIFRIRATRAGGAAHPPPQGHRGDRAAVQRRPGEGHRPRSRTWSPAKKLHGIADLKDLTDRHSGPAAWSSRSRAGSTRRRCWPSSTG